MCSLQKNLTVFCSFLAFQLTIQFAKVDDETLAALAADPSGLLTQVLLYHVVPGIVLAEDLTGGDTATTSQGSTVTVTMDGGMVGINGAGVETTNILASNGVIHVIDAVLIPPNLGPSEPSTPDQGGAQSIVEIAAGNDMFTTLVTALGAAGLVEALQGEGPFTVLAPTNEGMLLADLYVAKPKEVLFLDAFWLSRNLFSPYISNFTFSAFNGVDVSRLLEDQWSAHLQAILLYHVVSGKIMSTDLGLNLSAPTLEGSFVTVTSFPDPVKIDDATVLQADIEASNGVIHVVDEVLLPPSATNDIVDISVADDTFSTLVDLVSLANLVETLQGDGPFTIFAPTNEGMLLEDVCLAKPKKSSSISSSPILKRFDVQQLFISFLETPPGDS